MYSPVHATVGALIVNAIPNPAIGLPLALASHYLLDAIPHGDLKVGHWMRTSGRHFFLAVALDFGLAVVVISLLLVGLHRQPTALIIFGAFLGMLPDLLWGVLYWAKKIPDLPFPRRLLQFHQSWHEFIHAKSTYDVSLWFGLSYQLVTLAIVVWLVR